jgi:hypothetical protein
MPLDPEPVEDGNVMLIRARGQLMAYLDDPANGTHVTHFATCPNATEHRRER